jgi:kinesin family member 3B
MSQPTKKGSKKDTAAAAAAADECVQVAVRCRPLFGSEISKRCKSIVSMHRQLGQVQVEQPNGNPARKYTFDTVFPQDTRQVTVYEETARRIVDSVLEGYNGTIFAYGQTGTGKTYTMEGKPTEDELGVIPRAFRQIFEKIAIGGNDTEFLVEVQFIEIYNDKIFDLLAEKDADAHKNLQLREEKSGSVYVQDAVSKAVESVEDMNRLHHIGLQRRMTGETKMNRDSSRSHCVFMIRVEIGTMDGTQQHIRVGKLNMVDLAGSERQSKTAAVGIRLQEAAKINLSLTALGNVISSLVNSRGKPASHIPYRDSKLTFLLRDSLGGNTKTVMIANIGPADYNFEETVTTLKFANRAKNIKNKPMINEDPKDAKMREYRDIIARLEKQLELADKGILAPIAGAQKSGASLRPKMVIEETEIVHVGASPEELLKIQRDAEAKRRELEQQASEEKEKLAQQRAQIEQEAQMTAQTLSQKHNILTRTQQDRETLQNQLQHMKKKLHIGKLAIDEAERQEAIIANKRKQFENKQRELAHQRQEWLRREEMKTSIVKRFDTQEEELNVKNQKLEQLRGLYAGVKKDVEEALGDNQKKREEMLENIRQLTKLLQLKDMIVQAFIPAHEHEKLQQRAEWSNEQETWIMKPTQDADQLLAMKRPSSSKQESRPTSEFARISRLRGDASARFRDSNILDLQLDVPEENTQDYFLSNDAEEDDDELMMMNDDAAGMYADDQLYGSGAYDNDALYAAAAADGYDDVAAAAGYGSPYGYAS